VVDIVSLEAYSPIVCGNQKKRIVERRQISMKLFLLVIASVREAPLAMPKPASRVESSAHTPLLLLRKGGL